MSATVSLEPRRARELGRAPARELPVLFHLMDVSLLTPQPSVSDHIPAPAEPQAAEPESVSPVACEIITPDPPPATEIKPFIDPDPPVAVDPDPSVTAEVERIEPPVDLPAEIAQSPIVEQGPPPVSEITPRPSDARPLRTRSRVSNDWFTVHGKYIAIGFVLALVGTIYWARANRESIPPIVDSQPHAHPGEVGDQLTSQSKPATGVDESKAEAKSTTTAGVAEISPAKLADAPISQQKPQTDLHAPTIPQLVSEPTPDKRQADSGLFPWGDQSDERVAARPDVPQPAPLEQPGPQYPLTDSNAGMPQSYSTGFPPGGRQGAGTFAAPPTQPSVQNHGGNSFQPSAPELANGPGLGGATIGQPPGGSPPQYAPQDNTARGNRYERTGSGPY